jgi:bifunctional DNase/RNase
MQTRKEIALALLLLVSISCRTMVLSNKTININQGDPKSRVMEIMGTPEDRQFMARNR